MPHLTIEEFESIVDSWPFPWPNYLHLLKTTRQQALDTAETEAEKHTAEQRYQEALSTLLDEATKERSAQISRK